MVYRYNPYASAVYYGSNDYRDYIAHFRLPGTPNKDHKYIKKIGEGAKAVYIYATNAAKNAGRSVGRFVDNNITGSTYKKNATEYGAKALSAYDKAKAYGANNLPLSRHESESEAKEYARKASDETAKYRKTLAGRLTSAIDKTKSSFRAAKTLVGSVLGKIGGTLSSIGSGILSKGRSIVSSILGAPSAIKGKLAENKRHKEFKKSVKRMTKTASKAPKKKKAVDKVYASTPLASPYGSSLNRKISETKLKENKISETKLNENRLSSSSGKTGVSALQGFASKAQASRVLSTDEINRILGDYDQKKKKKK